jgi:hypothetical protein
METGGNHFVPAYADKAGTGITFAEGADQSSTEYIAGGFSGYDANRYWSVNNHPWSGRCRH